MVLVKEIQTQGGEADYLNLARALRESDQREKNADTNTVRQMMYYCTPSTRGGTSHSRRNTYPWIFMKEGRPAKIRVNWLGWAKELDKRTSRKALKITELPDREMGSKFLTIARNNVNAGGAELIRCFVEYSQPETIEQALNDVEEFIYHVLTRDSVKVDLLSMGVENPVAALVYAHKIAMRKSYYTPGFRSLRKYIKLKDYE